MCLLLLAFTAMAQQPADKVIERYKQMLEKNPAEGTALDRLWQAYLESGRTAELFDEYNAGGTFTSEMLFGLVLRKAGKSDEALAAFERAAALDAGNPLPLFALAKLHTEAGHPRYAAAALEKALALLPAEDPRQAETLLQLGAAWLAASELLKAADAWERAAALHPEDLELRRRLADSYARNHLAERAVPHIEYIVAHAAPAERAAALQQLARVQQGAGNQDGALRALEQALALTTPGNWLRAELQSQIIRLHQRYHRTPELEEKWKQFAAENPRDAGAYLQLIDLYERLGDLEAQRVWLDKLVSLLPRNADYRLKLARLHAQNDMLGAATAMFDQLLTEQPANTDLVFERARIDVQRDAPAAARDRIAALLRVKANDETVRARALEFYEQNRLLDLVENHLLEDAVGDSGEALVALVNFYFSQRREADALRALDRLARPLAPAAEQAAAQLQIAQILKAHSHLPAAVAALEKAAQLQPEARECQMLLGELQTARGEMAAAQAAFERAYALSKTPAEEIEADQKWFESVQKQTNPESNSAALLLRLDALGEQAAAAPTEAGWLRLARWRSWAREQKGAIEAALHAVEINPNSVAAYEFLVKIYTAESATQGAVAQLAKLMEIDPSNRVAYLRRTGQLELQAGRIPQALEVFAALAESSAGSVEALTDLALAQQRAERWTDALDTWRQVYALSPVSKKKEALTQVLRVLERLEQHPQAVELMLRAIETEADEREQFAQFADLLAYCTRHEMLDWLRVAFEKRRKQRADDYFTEMALGRILKAAGNKAAAFEVLADASYAAPNQAESLPELVREAEELGKLDAAAKLQARLLRIAPQDRAEGFEKLAQLQEKNFDLEEAAKTWGRIAAKFPRDAGALHLAVEFQIQWGAAPRAIELLRRVRALEPSNLPALATLAGLDLEAGESAEAEACLEEILRLAPVEKSGEPLRIPELKAEDASQLQLAYRSIVRQRNGRATSVAMSAFQSFPTEEKAAGKGDRDLRFNAIRKLAQLQQARGTLDAWIERWSGSAVAPSEALWALYYAGAGGAALDAIEAAMARDAANVQLKNAFLWLALQTRQFARLGAWMQNLGRTAAERDYLLVALSLYVQSHSGRIDPQAVAHLFPGGSTTRLWQAAQVFASRAHLREATQLGQRVFDSLSTQRAAYSSDLAGWYLQLGEIDKAIEILRSSIRTTGESFDAPVYAALRDYWLLLAPGERSGFAESYLASFEPAVHPLHRAIAGALLHGLSGEQAAARADLDRLASLGAMSPAPLDDTGSAAGRRWNFLLIAGAQLLAWKLEPLAIHLWERALADTALIELEGEMALETARDVRRRLHALRIAHAATAEEAGEWLDAYLRAAPKDGALQLAESLENAGAHARAVMVHRQLWEQEPENLQALRNLLAACTAAGDAETAEAALTRMVGEGLSHDNAAAHLDNVLRLADLLDHDGRPEHARALLRQGMESAARDSRLALRFAQISERLGKPDDAVAACERVLSLEPRNTAAQMGLSSALEARGDLPAALRALGKNTTTEAEPRVALLHVKAGNPEEALAALARIPPPQNVEPAIATATALVEKGERKLARAALQSVLARNTDVRMRFPLQSKVVEILDAADGEAAILRELHRLRQLASEQPDLMSSYFELAQKHAARLGVSAQFHRELTASWADGAGAAAAGRALLTARLHDEGAKEVLDRLLAREDASEAGLQQMAELLRAADRPDFAARVYRQLAQINPVNIQHVLDLAKCLQQAGRADDAHAALGPLEAPATLNDEIAGRLARAYAALGDGGRARIFFQQALRGDPLARFPVVWLDFARLQRAEKDFAGARRTLRTAFGNRANTELGEIVAWLAASGRLDHVDAEVQDFAFTPARLTQLRRALFTHYEKAGDAARALALVEEHPETAAPGLAARLRALAKSAGDFEPAAKVLEKLAALSPDPPDIFPELARLYGDWAEADLEARKPDAAIAHLQLAQRACPALFEVARRLATVQAERGDRAGAIETLQKFLGTAKDAGEATKARGLLTQLSANGGR